MRKGLPLYINTAFPHQGCMRHDASGMCNVNSIITADLEDKLKDIQQQIKRAA